MCKSIEMVMVVVALYSIGALSCMRERDISNQIDKFLEVLEVGFKERC